MHHTIDINVVHYRIPSTPVRIFLMRIQNMCIYISHTFTRMIQKKRKKEKESARPTGFFLPFLDMTFVVLPLPRPIIL